MDLPEPLELNEDEWLENFWRVVLGSLKGLDESGRLADVRAGKLALLIDNLGIRLVEEKVLEGLLLSAETEQYLRKETENDDN